MSLERATITLLLLTACAGTDVREGPARCTLERSVPQSVDGSPAPVRPVRQREWLSLLLGERARFGSTSDRDCTGAPIATRVPSCATARTLSPIIVTEDSLIDVRVSSTERLVYVSTHRDEDATLAGPLARVKVGPAGVSVRSLGIAAGVLDRPRLRMLSAGASEIVVLESERCESEGHCLRVARLHPDVNGQLGSVPLETEDGQCAGDAEVVLADERVVPLGDGWQRRFRLAASLAPDRHGLVLEEQVIVVDEDLHAPDAPPRTVRQVDAERHIVFYRDAVRTDTRPLLDRVVEDVGSTQLPPERT